MKRIFPIFLLLLLLLLLVGCQGAFSNEYVYVTEHVAPFAVKEETTTQEAPPQTEETLYTATNLKGVRDAIKDMVRNGEEEGKILLEFHEEDAKELDVNNLLNALCNDSPLYVYAMHQDSFSCELNKKGFDPVLSVSFKLRLAAREVASIEKTGTFWFKEEALNYIYEALIDQKSSCTMQVSDYDADVDLVALLDEYILHHPEEVSDAPEIQVTVFPVKGGSVRVLDFLFSYKENPAYLSYHKIKTNQFFKMVLEEMTKTESGTESEIPAKDAVGILYRQLISASSYDISEDATVYSLVVEKKKSNSRVMASVVEYLCCKAGWECEIVIGTHGGERWYWNRLKEDGQWRYFDLQTAAGKREEPDDLYSAEKMRELQYEWDSSQYPEAEPPADPTEPTDPDGTSEETQTPFASSELPQTSEGEASSEPLQPEPTQPEPSAETEPFTETETTGDNTP